MDIKISVIVPVYNVENYIAKCLDSLVQQTLQEIEIIIVNDGSSDNSEDIVMQYRNKYSNKIRYYKKENGGLSDARNYGMGYAKGEYITFLDSDDFIEKDAYEMMYRASEGGKKNVVECDFYWEYPKKRVWDKAPDYRDVKDYLIRGRVVAWNKLYRRDWLENIDIYFPKGLLYEDVEFFFSLMPHLKDISDVAVVRKPYVHYVQRTDSISYKESIRITDICKVYMNSMEYLKTKNLLNQYDQELEYKFVRNVLWGFPLKKVRNIKEKKIKRIVVDSLWTCVNNERPQWKKNKYLSKVTLPNLYLHFVRRPLFRFLFLYLL